MMQPLIGGWGNVQDVREESPLPAGGNTGNVRRRHDDFGV
jgi:hypothetical protein